MEATISTAIRALKRHIEGLKRGRIDRPDDIAFWCLNILATSPTDYSAWATRRPYRAAIRRPRKANQNAKGRQALVDFIAVTIANLESGYRTKVDVYNLPDASVRTFSESHKANLSAAKQRLRQEREEARTRRFVAGGLLYAGQQKAVF
jgi:hypothetical protein